tara:strand:- start:191 stop:1117 length:927 start_codon:yes stop_codon:yes gene_type:complete
MNIFKQIIIILVLINSFINLKAFENKIVVKLDNEIITSLDIENEARFLTALNPQLKDLDNKQVFNISKNSIIRQKIKKIEILKYTNELIVEDKYLNKLIKSNYSKLGLENVNDFENYMKNYNIDLENIKEKMMIEATWNELIFKKYSSKIKINEQELKNEILANKNEVTSYKLSEILFSDTDNSKLNEKYIDIKNIIKNSSFENAALIYSVSSTSSLGGDLGWIEENSLNKRIQNELLNLKKGEITKPILTSSGFLILMVKDKKKIEKKINFEQELQKMINIRTNQQFSQYSNMFFKKISKNISINEL